MKLVDFKIPNSMNSEELNTMLVIAMLVLLISLWFLLSLASIPGVLGRIGKRHMVTFLPMVDT